MVKTDRQQLLELRHGKPIRQLIKDTLQKYRGARHYATRAALDLDITISTLHKWVNRMGIDLKAYGPKDDPVEDNAVEEDAVPAGAGQP